MSIRKTIVTYRQIDEAFNKRNHEAVASKAQEEANKVADDPLEAASFLAGLGGALDTLEAEEKVPGVLVSPDHPTASLLQTFLAQRANDEGGKLEPLGRGDEFLEAKFDDKDIKGWIGSFFSWVKGIKKHDFLAPPAVPETFDNATRVALLGDWGTGLYGAPDCAKSIETDPDGYKLIIHLGDVYYAGDKGEVKERFLDLWPRNAAATSRALNSNHEMYTGGHAYFELTLREFGQSSSCFAMQNDHWLLVGLDTGYTESVFNRWHGGLSDEQVQWLRSTVDNAGPRKVIFFSHHQPFTYLDKKVDNNMVEKLGDVLASKKIFAWYWGHEHRCILYDQHPLWGFYGRCIGHSGYPYFRDKLGNADADPRFSSFRRLPQKNTGPGGAFLDAPNPYVDGHENEYGAQGYMWLQFDGDHLTETVCLPDRNDPNSRIYENQLA
jgi:hypothetical protein